MSGESKQTDQPKVFPAEGGEHEQTIKDASTEAPGHQNGGSKELPTSDSEQGLSFQVEQTMYDDNANTTEASDGQNDGSRDSPCSDHQQDYKPMLAGTSFPDTHANPPGKLLVTASPFHKAAPDEKLNRDTTQMVMHEVSQLTLDDKHPATVSQKPPVEDTAATVGSPETITEPVQEEGSREVREVIEKGKEGKTLTPSESQILIKEVEHLTKRNRDLESEIDIKKRRIGELTVRIKNESAMSAQLEQEKQKLENEVKKLKAEKEALKIKMMSLEDAEFYRSFVAQSDRRQDVCILCRKKEKHDDKECWKCRHTHSDHKPKGACTTCKRCNCFMGKKDSEDRETCQKCHHPKQNHEMGSCEHCDCLCKEFRALVIAKSHAYPKASLELKCGKDVHSILDGRRCEAKSASNCWWYQLCTECEDAISQKETKFTECLKDPRDYSADRQEIRSVDADILLVNTFRALPHSVCLGHYRHCADCKKYGELIQEWVLRARNSILNLKQTPVSCVFTEPKDAGHELLFYFLPHPPEGHLVEFPIICNVEVGNSCCLMIYAQIPPFYWAYPLQPVPDEISFNFLRVVEAMNEELRKKQQEFFESNESAQGWKLSVQKGLERICKEKDEWDNVRQVLDDKKKAFLESSKTDEEEVKSQQDKEQKMFKSLCSLKKKYVPPEQLKLVISILQDHCLRVVLEASRPEKATFTV